MTQVEIDELVAVFNAGHYLELENRARTLLIQHPASGFAWKVFGLSLQMQGKDANETLPALRKAHELLPHDAEACSNLGNALRDLGQIDAAIDRYRHALTLKPDFVEVHCNLGNLLRDIGQYDHAMDCYRRALVIKPDHAITYYNFGNALRDLGHRKEAADNYRQAITFMPEFAEAYNNLGTVLRDLGQVQEALENFHRAITIYPQYVDAYYNLGNAFADVNNLAQAEACYRIVLNMNGQHADACNNLGNVVKEQGRLAEAGHFYDAAISIKPDFIDAHYSLSPLKTYREQDPHRQLLEQQLGKIPDLPYESQVRYWFTLGKMREDIGHYEASFAAYQAGNQLKRSTLAWDDHAEEEVLKQILSIFSKDFLSPPPLQTNTEKSPIFIVGMPRSGTSLLEQILSTCTGVFGAGELSDLSEVITAAMPDANFAHFPAAVTALSQNDFQHMGQQYIERTWRHAPTASRIIDKMPSNFYYLGMIHRMLPHARIIHARRDPMDSCFSCYARLFIDDNLPFTYDLQALGRYYVRYEQLMQHWHAVLPTGTILDLRYEDLVTNTEQQARRLLDYLGLPWDDRCLAFHQNERQVKTASASQVRQPIYQTSKARWKRFENHLAPLWDTLKNHR